MLLDSVATTPAKKQTVQMTDGGGGGGGEADEKFSYGGKILYG